MQTVNLLVAQATMKASIDMNVEASEICAGLIANKLLCVRNLEIHFNMLLQNDALVWAVPVSNFQIVL